MGVEIKLTDKEFPVSPVFVDFLHRHLENRAHEATWHDQLSEELIPAQADEKQKAAVAVADRVLQDPAGQKAILRSYELLTALLTGQPEKLRPFYERYRFICVVGCPRHGGSYLTKQLFRATGMDPERVPNAIAHDGFPDAAPFQFKENYNSLTTMIQNMAEYLAMVETYFANSRVFDNRIVVPKKATKAAYHGAFFSAALGPDTEYIITLRHPLSMAQSVLDKSGGMPKGGIFNVRSAIERWALDDWMKWGVAEATVKKMSYLDVFLGYWKRYHYQIAMEAIPTMAATHLLPYGGASMTGAVKKFYSGFGTSMEPEPFKEAPKPDFGAQENQKGDAVVQQVAAFWKSLGLTFPLDGVLERN